ncbi:MAG: hypothetical protein Q4C95_11165 [Planctomycetia bacterium]|nr:hypothetical protein [Planctomycetia bacterium]
MLVGLFLLVQIGGCLFDHLKQYQENQVRLTEVDPESLEKRKQEVEADPQFQQLINNNQKLDEALTALQEADQILTLQNETPNSSQDSKSDTESNSSLKSEYP